MLPFELILGQDRESGSDYKSRDEHPFGSSTPPVAEVVTGYPLLGSSSHLLQVLHTARYDELHCTVSVARAAVTTKPQHLGG